MGVGETQYIYEDFNVFALPKPSRQPTPLHVMCDAPQAFYLIVQRQLMDEKEPDLQSDLLPHLFVDQDYGSSQKGKYLYRVLAANLDLNTNWDEHNAVHFYDQRGEASENRIKELRSDFGSAR